MFEEAVNQRTENTMAKRKRTKWQIYNYGKLGKHPDLST
jgi:hypothetical protein